MKHPDDFSNWPDKPMTGDLGKQFEKLKVFIKDPPKDRKCKHCQKPLKDHNPQTLKCPK